MQSEFSGNKGLSQGCCRASTLVKIYLNEVLKTCWKVAALRENQKKITLYTLKF